MAALSTVKEKKNPFGSFKEKWNTFKSMVSDSPEYQVQKIEFDNRLRIDEAHWDKDLTKKEIEDAKRNQQLLTKLVEKIGGSRALLKQMFDSLEEEVKKLGFDGMIYLACGSASAAVVP